MGCSIEKALSQLTGLFDKLNHVTSTMYNSVDSSVDGMITIRSIIILTAISYQPAAFHTSCPMFASGILGQKIEKKRKKEKWKGSSFMQSHEVVLGGWLVHIQKRKGERWWTIHQWPYEKTMSQWRHTRNISSKVVVGSQRCHTAQ